eukprot:CAMPEP_0177663710 /NCGR_PEP_ID=MMETSP0447-20121125/20070_1 /TAXON_ID=0 /ORGANISM="Stygamoeba regulata, Strain BSH-02190019" /LENGTH=359 /DNA_ID=CAMNT_0019169563 /DNA_START=25 /DNA_END=1104 /DNA_ORIENTATION=+
MTWLRFALLFALLAFATAKDKPDAIEILLGEECSKQVKQACNLDLDNYDIDQPADVTEVSNCIQDKLKDSKACQLDIPYLQCFQDTCLVEIFRKCRGVDDLGTCVTSSENKKCIMDKGLAEGLMEVANCITPWQRAPLPVPLTPVVSPPAMPSPSAAAPASPPVPIPDPGVTPTPVAPATPSPLPPGTPSNNTNGNDDKSYSGPAIFDDFLPPAPTQSCIVFAEKVCKLPPLWTNPNATNNANLTLSGFITCIEGTSIPMPCKTTLGEWTGCQKSIVLVCPDEFQKGDHGALKTCVLKHAGDLELCRVRNPLTLAVMAISVAGGAVVIGLIAAIVYIFVKRRRSAAQAAGYSVVKDYGL